MLGGFLQVVLALVLVAALYLIAFWVYNKEALQANKVKRNPRVKTVIFRGIKDLSVSNNEMYNTSDPDHPTFRSLPPSVNQVGGAEFTYNFWLYKPENNQTNSVSLSPLADYIEDNDVVLVLRGSDKKLSNIKDVCGKAMPSGKENYLLKCPLIKLQGPNRQYLTVEFNTTTSPNAVQENTISSCNNSSGEWISVNKYKLALDGLNDANFVQKWFMVSVVIADTDPKGILPVRNKVRVRIYVNGVLELERYADSKLGGYETNTSPSVLLQNQGPLYVGKRLSTSGTFPKIYMADLTYMNYAASPDEVKKMFETGFDKAIAASVNQSSINEYMYKNTAQNLSQARGEPQLSPI